MFVCKSNTIRFALIYAQLIILTSPTADAIHECCPELNVLLSSNQSCLTGDSNGTMINLNCTSGTTAIYITDEWDSFGLVLHNDELLNEANETIEFCQSNYGEDSTASSLIYIVCMVLYEDASKISTLQVQAILGYISAFFVILTIIVHCMVPNLLDLQGICIMHTLISLASGYIFLGVIQLKADHEEGLCKAYAYIIYVSFIYMFFWLVVLSFHIWRITVKPNLSKRTINWPVFYHIFAISGCAICFLIILLAHHSPSAMWDNFRPGFGEVACWFKEDKLVWIYFYGPIIVLLCCNVFFYGQTVLSLWQQTENRRSKLLKYRLKLYVKLSVIMGITWVIEILTASVKDWYNSTVGNILLFLMDLVNSLQGLSIFLVLVVFRKRVRRELARRNICGIKFPHKWRYLEDEEMGSTECRANETTVEFSDVKENAEFVSR